VRGTDLWQCQSPVRLTVFLSCGRAGRLAARRMLMTKSSSAFSRPSALLVCLRVSSVLSTPLRVCYLAICTSTSGLNLAPSLVLLPRSGKRPAWRDRRPFPSLDALGPLRRGASGQRYAPPSIGGRPRKQTVDAPLAARLALQTDNHPARRAFIALPGVVRSADVKAVPHLVVSVAERLCRASVPYCTTFGNLSYVD
jgi:hypothetical protein